MQNFDPNAAGNNNNNIFGLPFTEDNAQLIFVPVPWDATVSYRTGSAGAPEAIFEASLQVDLFDPFKKNAWDTGYAMCEIPQYIKDVNKNLRTYAQEIIENIAKGEEIHESEKMLKAFCIVNNGCAEMNAWVKNKTKELLQQNKLVALMGGEHSVPLGFLEALSEKFDYFGILQIDAHADLRKAYEGLEFSHASIMYNALKFQNICKLVQVGIRDYCKEEFDLIINSKGRIATYFDSMTRYGMFEGKTWKDYCDYIIKDLPENVYVSFDVDGLDPKLCPNTGTPVPGGLEFNEVFYLFERLVLSGKKIIGFDLCEVAPGDDEWDANVGARILYRLANIMSKSNGF